MMSQFQSSGTSNGFIVRQKDSITCRGTSHTSLCLLYKEFDLVTVVKKRMGATRRTKVATAVMQPL